MNRFRTVGFTLCLLAVCLMVIAPIGASQTNASIPVQTSIIELVTLSITGGVGGTLHFPSYSPNTNVSAESPLVVSLVWNSFGTEVAISTCGFFGSSTAAPGSANALSTSGGSNILASEVKVTVTGTVSNALPGPTYTGIAPGLASNLSFAGGNVGGTQCSGYTNGVMLFQHNVASCPNSGPSTCGSGEATAASGTATQNLALVINSAQTAAGTYNGTFNVVALLQ